MNDAQSIEGVQIPDHVPRHLVVDFDIYNPTTDANRFHEAFVDFQRETPHPFVWSPHHGGHWIPVRGPDVFALYGDHERFSSRYFFVPAAPEQVSMGALTLDPPEHQPFRAFLNAGMTPKIFAERSDFVRNLAKDIASSLAPSRRCEFISQMGDVLPLSVFLDLANLPQSDREKLGTLAEATVRDLEPGKRIAAMEGLAAYLEPVLAARRGTNGEDLFSRTANAMISGRPVTDAEALGAAIHLVMAGLDTVSSLLSFVMLFLAQNPRHRQALVDDPELIPKASLELIRRFPIVTMARQARGDFTIEGTQFKQGDMVAIASHLFNLDPSIYERPLEVDWNRPVHKILTFGHGPHRCPGALLGRNELVIGLQEWLRHIPHFELEKGAEVTVSGGTVAKITKLPLVW